MDRADDCHCDACGKRLDWRYLMMAGHLCIGGRDLKSAVIFGDDAGDDGARVSYNGRVWPPGEWNADMVLWVRAPGPDHTQDFPVRDALAAIAKATIETAVEILIDLLDLDDGDVDREDDASEREVDDPEAWAILLPGSQFAPGDPADVEPSLGWTNDQSGIGDRELGDDLDLELDGADDEPSLGWTNDGQLGLGTGDLEDEHDGPEPDVDGGSVRPL